MTLGRKRGRHILEQLALMRQLGPVYLDFVPRMSAEFDLDGWPFLMRGISLYRVIDGDLAAMEVGDVLKLRVEDCWNATGLRAYVYKKAKELKYVVTTRMRVREGLVEVQRHAQQVRGIVITSNPLIRAP